jgi:glutamate racemase
MKIGIFDSGIGGESIAAALSSLIKDAEIISINDHTHMPYGTKTAANVAHLTILAIQPLITAGCDAIILACNTATVSAIMTLRDNYPNIHFIGLEPMIKPASQLTKSNTIAVLATPTTLKSTRYLTLKQQWANGVKVIEPDCKSWAEAIEYGQSDGIMVEQTINSLLEQKVDVIVLGCTHYHWIKQRIIDVIGDKDVSILEPSDAIARRLNELID